MVRFIQGSNIIYRQEGSKSKASILGVFSHFQCHFLQHPTGYDNNSNCFANQRSFCVRDSHCHWHHSYLLVTIHFFPAPRSFRHYRPHTHIPGPFQTCQESFKCFLTFKICDTVLNSFQSPHNILRHQTPLVCTVDHMHTRYYPTSFAAPRKCPCRIVVNYYHIPPNATSHGGGKSQNTGPQRKISRCVMFTLWANDSMTQTQHK